MKYLNKQFIVRQKNNDTTNLCEGIVTEYLGKKDDLDHYKVQITITFIVKGRQPIKEGEIAVNDNKFYIATKPGRMMDCSKEVEWLND